jgi:ABC-type transporter Mla maintaining outer membrane lipid asymmetry permease subunit MlaE
MTGCCVGLRTHGGTEGVRSTTQAVVSSLILIIAADFLNNLIIYLLPMNP